ncbi:MULTISPECIES: vitamin B12 ABC transporter ATP-binding protein BtuD [unclassified Photobacterium]|uniref:vitamin B12 ABC transporter ATP-binding protein BtuD n=1 Tax=unclassified Photobacterium TaxID=2628852 RepID=UPI001EE0C433|nr:MULTISPECIES: vitamin B12 ABC transporter ATP-binding protein BtuD [unclassified Photobacterium]MCG3862966.1 vitamin B12 ABC transporter ATP-binding protein BtuD [Photobacterium sp. Ph6]MCG3874497.1 vitamin B12 ABC transporter ATP-binding protein BtuD [Photobacterium sp. Ph5]
MPMLMINRIAADTRLKPLSFSVDNGEIVHFIGPNGSGKSTAIELISGLFSTDGSVTLEGVALTDYDLASLARVRSYMSQQDKPSFAIPVYQYLLMAFTALGEVDDIIKQGAIDEVCGYLGIVDKLSRSIQQLSGGEWQRVRLASACLQVWPALNPDAKYLLLDEPAASLDIGQEVAMYKLIRKIASQGVAVIMANHDLNRTLREADKVLLLEAGHCIAVGSAQEVMIVSLLERVFKTGIVKVNYQGIENLVFVD